MSPPCILNLTSACCTAVRAPIFSRRRVSDPVKDHHIPVSPHRAPAHGARGTSPHSERARFACWACMWARRVAPRCNSIMRSVQRHCILIAAPGLSPALRGPVPPLPPGGRGARTPSFHFRWARFSPRDCALHHDHDQEYALQYGLHPGFPFSSQSKLFDWFYMHLN